MQLFRCARDVGRGGKWQVADHTTAAGGAGGDCGTSFTAAGLFVRICKMFIVKAQPNIEVEIELRLPKQAPYAAILCHTLPYSCCCFVYKTSFLRRDFWYLKRDGARVRARAALSPRALLNPFAPFFRWPTCRIRYIAPTLRIRIVVTCVSLRLQKNKTKTNLLFDFWPKRAAFWHFVCIWTNFDCAWPESAAAHESNQLWYVFRPNVIMEYGEIADCKPVCLW